MAVTRHAMEAALKPAFTPSTKSTAVRLKLKQVATITTLSLVGSFMLKK
jgi:hypothetical protein